MSESFVTVITFEEGKISAQEGKGSFYFLEKTEQRVANWLSVGTSAQGTYQQEDRLEYQGPLCCAHSMHMLSYMLPLDQTVKYLPSLPKH